MALGELRRFLGLTAVLSPALLERFAGEDLGPQQRWRLALVQLLLDARAGHRATWSAALTPPRILTALPLRWTVELALRRADAGDRRGVELIDYLAEVVPEPATALVPEVARQVGLVDTGGRLAARIGRPPERPLRVAALGPLRVEVDGEPVGDTALGRVRVRQLLALLVLRERVDRDQVLSLLWPDLDRPRAQNNLRVTLTHLRQLLEPDRAGDAASYLLLAGRRQLQLRRCDQLVVDLWETGEQIGRAGHHERAGRLTDAIDCYQRATRRWTGRAILADLAELDDLRPELVELELRLVDAACRQGELLIAARRPEEAIAPAMAALRADPLQERAHRVSVSARLAVGDRRGALEAMEHCRATLIGAGLQPAEETLMVARSLEIAGSS